MAISEWSAEATLEVVLALCGVAFMVLQQMRAARRHQETLACLKALQLKQGTLKGDAAGPTQEDQKPLLDRKQTIHLYQPRSALYTDKTTIIDEIAEVSPSGPVTPQPPPKSQRISLQQPPRPASPRRAKSIESSVFSLPLDLPARGDDHKPQPGRIQHTDTVQPVQEPTAALNDYAYATAGSEIAAASESSVQASMHRQGQQGSDTGGGGGGGVLTSEFFHSQQDARGMPQRRAASALSLQDVRRNAERQEAGAASEISHHQDFRANAERQQAAARALLLGEGASITSALHMGDRGWLRDSPSCYEHQPMLPCDYPAQVYKLGSEFLPKDWIKGKWEQGFDITSVEGFGATGGCLVVMSKGPPFAKQSKQSFKVAETGFPLEWVNKKWNQGCHITSLATLQGRWAVVMSSDAGYVDQCVELDLVDESASIQRRLDAGFRITAHAASPRQSAVVLSRRH